MESINQDFHIKIVGISKRQAVIKLTEKRDHNKQFLKKLKNDFIVKC